MSHEDPRRSASRRGAPRGPFSGQPWWWWATAILCAIGILGSVVLLNF